MTKQQRHGGRSARVLQQITTAVVQELSEVGLADFSTPRVAARAGVHTATIYRRWENSAQLISEVGTQLASSALPTPDTGSLRGDLIAIMKDVRAFLARPEGAVFVAAAFGSTQSPTLKEMMSLYWEGRVAARLELFQRAQNRGELSPQEDPEELLERCIGPLYVRKYLSARPIDDVFIERTVSAVLCAQRDGAVQSS